MIDAGKSAGVQKDPFASGVLIYFVIVSKLSKLNVFALELIIMNKDEEISPSDYPGVLTCNHVYEQY